MTINCPEPRRGYIAVAALMVLALSACDDPQPEPASDISTQATPAQTQSSPPSEDISLDTSPVETEATSPAPQTSDASQARGEADWTSEEQQLIARWRELNTECRGGTDQEAVAIACAERDDVVAKALTERNICYGRKGQGTVAYQMHRCTSDSLSFN